MRREPGSEIMSQEATASKAGLKPKHEKDISAYSWTTYHTPSQCCYVQLQNQAEPRNQ